MLIVISYIVWLTPAIFCAVVLYRYFIESKEPENIYKVFSSIGTVSLAVTFKQALLLKTHLDLTLSFIFGNGTILFTFVILTWFILKSFKNKPKPPKRMYLYIGIALLFVIYALFRGELLVSADLLIYAFLIILIMFDVYSAFNVIREEKSAVKIALFIFGITLFLDFILKSIVETNGFHALNIVKLISFSIRGSGALILLFTALKIEVSLPHEVERVEKIKRILRAFTKKFVVATILFSIALNVLIVAGFHDVVNSANAKFSLYKSSATSDVLATGKNFRRLVLKYGNELSDLALQKDIIFMNEEGKKKLVSYFDIHKDQIDSITRMNQNGTIIFTYPYGKSIGTSIKNQPHVKELLTLHRAVLSPPIISVQGFPVIILHVPVFNGNEFYGSLAVLFDMNRLWKEIVATHFKGEKIVIAGSKNTIICAPFDEMLFKNAATIFPFRDVNNFVKCAFGEGLLVQVSEDVFWDRTYTIFAFVPKKIVLKGLAAKILEFFILFVSFIAFFLYAIHELSAALLGEIANLKEFAEKKYIESKSLYKKLSKLIELFSGIDVNEDIKSISFKMLNSMLAVVPSGEAGSVIIKKGDRYVFTAQVGYGKILEGNFFTKEEITKAKSSKPFIIKRIFEVPDQKMKKRYRKSLRKLLKSIGTDKVKATIEAPIIVNDEYYGGIFLDSFESENAFTDEDLKIAEAISKLGSILIAMKKLISSLSETEEKLDVIINEFSEVDLSMEEEEFFERILSLARRLIPADAGSITLRKGDYYEYMAIFGFNEKLKEIKLKVSDAYKFSMKKAVIVKNIAEYNEEHLPEKERAIIMGAGGKNVKQTLVSPTIVDNEYIGGIFLDSFKEGNVFTERDLKIATALSKLSSVFVAMKIAYENIARTSKLNEASVNLFHNLNVKSANIEVLKITFRILSSVFGNTVEEVAIGEMDKNKIILNKFNGKEFGSDYINSGAIMESVKNEKAIFNPGNKKVKGRKGFAQVIVFSKNKFAPIFRVRFNRPLEFTKQEEGFLERFGREAINAYQMIFLYSNIKKSLISYIFSVGNAVNSYDPYTEWHSTRVAFYSMKIAEALSLSVREKGILLLSAVLHDVGKISIPRDILLKQGKLTKEEFAVIKKHPLVGERIVEPINREAAKIIRHHHEKWNGKGYPDGLKGEEIPLLSRIITVADVFDALTTNRPYRKAFTVEKALGIMVSERGKMFDPCVLDIFLSFPKGTLDINAINKLTIEEMEKYIVEI